MTRLPFALVAGALVFGVSHPRTSDAASPPATVARADAAPRPAPILRESATVRVGTTAERWRLEWRSTPAEACVPETTDYGACPCSGFEFAEVGALDLVRQRPGHADERLALAPLFRGGEAPADDTLAVLRRWPTLDADFGPSFGTDTIAHGRRVRARANVRAMTMRDYDHDGRATEFALQVGTLPCGHHQMVVVGVSTADSSLHAFTSRAHPERPLVLEEDFWNLLARSGGRPVTGIELACGDHGSETLTEVRLTTSGGRIAGTRTNYVCTAHDRRGRRLSTETI